MSLTEADRKVLEFEPGDVVLPQGQIAKGLYILMEGTLEVIYEGVKVAEITQKGSFVGEIASLLGGRRIATVKALAPCKLMVIDRVTEYLENNASSSLLIAQTLAARIMEMNKKISKIEKVVSGWIEAGNEAVAKEDIQSLRSALDEMQRVFMQELRAG